MINVKIIAKGANSTHWRNQLPNSSDTLGDCHFIFEREASNYDFLIVIDDVSRKTQSPPERLACADQHTLLVTTEPPTITQYGKSFTTQFHAVLTTHPEANLPHKNRIHSQTGNLWFNGHAYSTLQQQSKIPKTKTLSTVCSSKNQKHTLHSERLKFTEWICEMLPEIERFGHGFKPLESKFTALEPYRFHLAIENYRGPHHWTEKFSDAILSLCVPVYYGATNIGEYFPSKPFIEIDIYDRDEAFLKIRDLLINPEQTYKHYRPRLIEAKHLVLEKYNLMNMIHDHVIKEFNPSIKPSHRKIYGRKQIRARNPLELIRHIQWACKRSSLNDV